MLNHGRRQWHSSFFVILRLESPDRLCGDAHHRVLEVYIASGYVTTLAVAKAGGKAEFDKGRLVLIDVPEHCCDFLRLINRADRLEKTGPVAALDQPFQSMPFEELEHRNKAVVDRPRDESLLEAVAGELEDVLACHPIHVCLGVRVPEQDIQDGPVGSVGSQASVLADVIEVVVDG